MTNNTLNKRYDSEDAVLLITSYPEKKGESAKRNAISNYSRELARGMMRLKQVATLSEILSKKEMYEEEGVLVIRGFRQKSPFLTYQILREVCRFRKLKTIIFQFEFGIYGGVLTVATVPFVILLLRLLGKKVTFCLHQVVINLKSIDAHLGLEGSYLKLKILEGGLRVFYFLTGIFSSAIVVHNEFLKERLQRFVDPKKIYVIPHGVSFANNAVSKARARDILRIKKREKVLLCFGYLNWYKGSDWIARKVVNYNQSFHDRKIRLILAGGESGTLKDKPHYKIYIQTLRKFVRRHKSRITLTGYIPDRKISTYFSASDVLVFPYRESISESGPLSYAFSFGKPMLVSKKRALSVMAGEHKRYFDALGVDLKDICFDLKKNKDFEKKLNNLFENRTLYNQLSKVNLEVGKLRNWNKIAELYVEVATSTAYRKFPIFRLSYLFK